MGRNHFKSGFTLIEVIIVTTVIALLSLIVITTLRNKIDKANDANRKGDLERIAAAFEEYYSDHDCYPIRTILANCGGGELRPYLNAIPCDPVSKTPYCYVTDADHPACFQKYRILSTLKYLADPAIRSLGCNSGAYCGWEVECGADTSIFGYNWGISSLNVLLANPLLGSGPVPTPTPPGSLPPPGSPGRYACPPSSRISHCNDYGVGFDPEAYGCPITFADFLVCEQYCLASSTYWCKR